MALNKGFWLSLLTDDNEGTVVHTFKPYEISLMSLGILVAISCIDNKKKISVCFLGNIRKSKQIGSMGSPHHPWPKLKLNLTVTKESASSDFASFLKTNPFRSEKVQTN